MKIIPNITTKLTRILWYECCEMYNTHLMRIMLTTFFPEKVLKGLYNEKEFFKTLPKDQLIRIYLILNQVKTHGEKKLQKTNSNNDSNKETNSIA